MISRGRWDKTIDVRDFVSRNYTVYDGDESFLCGPTERTKKLWQECLGLFKQEAKKGGVLDVDTKTISTMTSHKPGFIDKKLEIIKGLQTDAPLKRAIKPLGGISIVERACSDYGYKLDKSVKDIYLRYRKTHNESVFDAYTEDILKARHTGLITGLPDSYSRGRIIGDYRRVALYGVDRLIRSKEADKKAFEEYNTGEAARYREEIADQINALKDMKKLGAMYGFDISRPAKGAIEATQWIYIGFLSAIKEQDGAAMSLGSVSNFIDVYIEDDLKSNKLTESKAQELIDDFVIKLRMVRHLRPKSYNEIFAGDPVWITESIAGIGIDGRHKVTKTSYRMLQTLFNLGPAPEPNITVLWSTRLPENFKRFCANVSIKTSAIQYENDDLMRLIGGDDYSISCCVSLLRNGSEMQYFGARCNLPKILLYALNQGRDEITGELVVPGIDKIKSNPLDYYEVKEKFHQVLRWTVKTYVEAMNIIHSMHDKYYYERAQMALLDSELTRYMAFGIAGLSVATDSLSAVRYAKVKAIRNKKGIAYDFKVVGDFPKFGNDDERVDGRAVDLTKSFLSELKRYKLHRDSIPTLSILTITSNVMYGKKTGATPDGRKKGAPFAPGANPMHGRDASGVIASLNSVASIPYTECRDGISNTFSVVPSVLGKTEEERISNLDGLLDGYFIKGAHHLNVNVMDKSMLKDAIKNPHKYPQLTIRVSGYAVHFNKLSLEQQQEVIARTFHEEM
ncbi:MAG: formate C-acetyltransferase [Candidatus Omnitrophica bacterium CG12_big_fil_rev_8_21_14_0_65_43_15]|uniref:Formate acetyltransferase n=1 Tax=Candidatus Taenaricola geysiri TaxID=1974752 RepID=A0A2J0LRG9_9BACT|nr:MAG: formate C-acetyltransferase [Candidatus Omnitrophica bacterium CG03_land_8_20_14_0_80_43_22]PIW66437.1 MAG: formate C-acetyltransferase [Candidatus Omnitrophica bacterium CG12_big_fil_rev_8_21_14_0_65_43_15]PIW80443.1 MAG: formate C-acetyltransferase [Candidatus Omnitrophica bacterium CG_4_8_14_3_um_filter_43_15]PIY84612.1 MAG: formate C-acetyltransferase [Candidatus Omnitrophica bacterium CG_4_10_14_0_8_um_filter_43_18]